VDLAPLTPHALITWALSRGDPVPASPSMSYDETAAKYWGAVAERAKNWRLPADVPLEERVLIWISGQYYEIDRDLRQAEQLAYGFRKPAERASAEVERASAEVERARAAADREKARRTVAPTRDQRPSGVDAARASLKEAEQEYERVVRLVQEEARSAEAEYDAARHSADRAAASMSSILATLETAITAATAPRNRIVPGTGR
jgi:hypothetical protein